MTGHHPERSRPAIVLVGPTDADQTVEEFNRYRWYYEVRTARSAAEARALSGDGAAVVSAIHGWLASANR